VNTGGESDDETPDRSERECRQSVMRRASHVVPGEMSRGSHGRRRRRACSGLRASGPD
jgi:hypothetical protein